MNSEIILVRHGQSANNALPEEQRVCDPELTEVGTRQAAAIAEWSIEMPITHLYCSPFLRALETTRPIAAAKQLAVQVVHNIYEQGGCYSGYERVGKRGEPGLGADEIRRRYSGWILDSEIADSGWWGRDYETQAQATVRSAKVAKWLMQDIAPTGGMHLLVIHADFKALLIQSLLADMPGVPQGDASEAGDPIWLRNGPLYNTGATRFQVRAGDWQLADLNSVEHLPTELVTC